MTSHPALDDLGRYVLTNAAHRRPFASFLPGIAGLDGVPLWAFYVNRGQGICSFGVESKDHPIMEFEPANKAYQSTPLTGFRTFVRWARREASGFWEPFAAATPSDLAIGANELELTASAPGAGLRAQVSYFVLPGEPFGALVRTVELTNASASGVSLEVLDGLARVIPYGVDNQALKTIGRTIEAWMAVFDLEGGVPFYRLQATADDSAEVGDVTSGHFLVGFDGWARRLQPFVDPAVVFGQDTSLSDPEPFRTGGLGAIASESQVPSGRTPCGLVGGSCTLAAGESWTLYEIVGHAGGQGVVAGVLPRICDPGYVEAKRAEARALAEELTDAIATRTSDPLFDGYARQTYLDNVLRGGRPVVIGDGKAVVHAYGRKHGDIERDYNDFVLPAEPYSSGNGAYRDLNQNRRCDVWFDPQVGASDVTTFVGLLQPDGYNPLVCDGLRFRLPESARGTVCELVERPEGLAPLLEGEFTPGELLRAIRDRRLGLRVDAATFVAAALGPAESRFAARFQEGYWIDHWLYNLDLIESFLAIFPDRADELFDARVGWYDSPGVVQPLARRCVLTGRGVRQYGAVVEDAEKASVIAERGPLVRRPDGEPWTNTVAEKLLVLLGVKVGALDPDGLGVAMEAGKPGWYDALNGLPGLFGSSLGETVELVRLARLLEGRFAAGAELPAEASGLLRAGAGDQAWAARTTALEAYRAGVRRGFGGESERVEAAEVAGWLASLRSMLEDAVARAPRADGVPVMYLTHEATAWDETDEADAVGRPRVVPTAFEARPLPLFLEGAVHALKLADADAARALHRAVSSSELFDPALGMYKVNAPLHACSHEIGRARAFTPGWLENESVWLHMEYKYLLELLRAGLYEEFFAAFRAAGVCFQDPEIYGRSPLENSSFLVSSAHPDPTLHGGGFVARLSGATAEFCSMWTAMMAGVRPFRMGDAGLELALEPTLPGWLFDDAGEVRFTFLGRTPVTVRNPARRDTWASGGWVPRWRATVSVDEEDRAYDGAIGDTDARAVRDGMATAIVLDLLEG